MRRKKSRGYSGNAQVRRKRSKSRSAKRSKEGRAGLARGNLNERRVELALIRQKHTFPFAVQCHNAFRNGELDVQGIDVIVSIPATGGLALLIQVKSSLAGILKHYRKHPYIPAMVANEETDDARIVSEVMDIINYKSALPFESASYLYTGRSQELKKLGGDAMLIFKNGFGLLLKRQTVAPYQKTRGKAVHETFPAVEIPGDWDERRFYTELPGIIAKARQRLLAELRRA